MKKLLVILLSLLALFVLVIGLLFAFRTQVTSYALSKTLNTPCSIQSLELSSYAVQIKGLTIQNPPGCTIKNALTVDHISVAMSWKGLFKALMSPGSNKLIINSVHIDNSTMGLELFTLNGSDTNWSRLLSALDSSPQTTPKATKPNTSAQSSSMDIQINTLVMNNIRFNVQYHSLSKTPFNPAPIPQIILTNIGSNGDVSAKQLFFIIFKVLIEQAATAMNLKTLIPEMIIEHVLPITAPFFELDKAKNLIENFFQSKPKDQNSK